MESQSNNNRNGNSAGAPRGENATQNALSDAECVEAQLVENIQREGVHPLEEAFAFHALLHTDGLNYDIQSLAAKGERAPRS
jgi:hypothetical protein